MKQPIALAHAFVKSIPEKLEERTLYLSMEYATAVHKCCCGCGNEVVTPLSPTDWKMTYDGVSVSLFPSIGNWGFDCQSHYWIESSTVKWAGQWSKEQIAAGRAHDLQAKRKHYAAGQTAPQKNATANSERPVETKPRAPFWSRVSSWLRGS